ncbi:MAG: carbohydrate ABC transporter permease, partial [Acutalibacter sp.]|nr:carbohydrate ABC transporter permease [Acutalibacter sp.]
MKSIAKKGGPARQSAGDRTFTIVNCIIMTLVTLVIVYPLWYVLVASLTDPVIVNSGKLLLYPESFYTQGYARAFAYAPLWTGYRNTLVYTVTGSAIALICTIPAGYALSRMDLPGRRGIMFLFTFTMFFNGGIIPLYLVVQNLHIYDSIWAVVLPVAV